MPGLTWLCIICVLSLTPGDQLPIIEFNLFKIDTVVHIIMYLLLSLLMLIGFFHQKNELNSTWTVCIVVSAIIIGLFIEILQGKFIPKRFFSWDDVLANSIGALIGYWTYKWYKKKELNLVRFLQ